MPKFRDRVKSVLLLNHSSESGPKPGNARTRLSALRSVVGSWPVSRSAWFKVRIVGSENSYPELKRWKSHAYWRKLGDSSQPVSRCNSTAVRPMVERRSTVSSSGPVRVIMVAEVPNRRVKARNQMAAGESNGI
jgi:hypothetical protein